MDKEMYDWCLRTQEKEQRSIERDVAILRDSNWRENDPGAQARLDLGKSTHRLCELMLQHGDDLFNYFDSTEGQNVVRDAIRTYQAMRVYVDEKKLEIDCEDDIAFLLELLHA